MRRNAGRAIFIALLTLVGLGITAAGLLPFDTARGIADSLSSDGHSEAFTPEFYAGRAKLLVFAGVATLLTTLALWFLWGQLVEQLAELSRSALLELRSLGSQTAIGWGHLTGFERTAFLLLLLIGVLLRLFYLSQPIRHDEAATYLTYASQKPQYLLLNYVPNNHFLHTLLVAVVTRLAGDSEWVIRIPAVFAGIATLPVVSFLGYKLHGATAALLATALAAVHPQLILYSTNARGYSLAGLLLLLLIIVAWIPPANGNSHGKWMLMVMLGALCLWTVPSMLYGVAATWLLAVILERGRNLREAIGFGIAMVIVTGVLYAPIMAASGWRSVLMNRWVVQTQPDPEIARSLPLLFWQLIERWGTGLPQVLAWSIVAGTLLSLFLGDRRLGVTAAIQCAVAGVFLAIQGIIPPARGMLYLLPILLSAAAAGWANLLLKVRTQTIGPALALVLGLTGAAVTVRSEAVTTFEETGWNPDARLVAEKVAPLLRPGDRILVTRPLSYPLYYWLQREKVGRQYIDWSAAGTPPRVFLLLDKTPPGLPAGQPISTLKARAIEDAMLPLSFEGYRETALELQAPHTTGLLLTR